MARNKFPGSGISLDALCKRYKIDNPLTDAIRKRIYQIEKQLYKRQRLNEDYIINKDQFLFPETKGDDLPE